MSIVSETFSDIQIEAIIRDNKRLVERFDLPLDTQEDKQEIFDLLYRTIFKDELDQTIITEVEQYLTRKVT
jgi:hypothetical protein